SEFEVRTNASFDALMWALSRPGLVRQLPAAGMAGIVESLIDRECRVYAQSHTIRVQAARAGAEIAGPEKADHVFVDELSDATLLNQISIGSDLYPETGATLVAPARFGDGPSLRLKGPGVDGTTTVRLHGVPPSFWEKRRDVMRYPMGFELFLIDEDQVLGFSRSTVVEVL
ncbi:MAG: phosphonate C-P lyase system protein PhnH, partial [Pseudomonadota bacterium]